MLPLVLVKLSSAALVKRKIWYEETNSTEEVADTIETEDGDFQTAEAKGSVIPIDPTIQQQNKTKDISPKALQPKNSIKTKPRIDLRKEDPLELTDSQKLNGSFVPNVHTDDIDSVKPIKLKPSKVNSNSHLSKMVERVMTLEPEKSQMFAFVAETVHTMVKSVALKASTEEYVEQFNRRYGDLPQIEADNAIWRKFSRAVVESFVLDFCNNYPKNTYNRAYDIALLHLEDRKGQTALQFSATVRRAADVLKAILDVPIGIVQSKCKSHMNQWQCHVAYLARLTEEADTCEHIWHHAHVHLTLLMTAHGRDITDPANKIIDEVESKLKEERNNDMNYLFDFTLRTLKGMRNQLRENLVSKAISLKLIKDLQAQDLLRCFNIDRVL